jgi:hypothetical protein
VKSAKKQVDELLEFQKMKPYEFQKMKPNLIRLNLIRVISFQVLALKGVIGRVEAIVPSMKPQGQNGTTLTNSKVRFHVANVNELRQSFQTVQEGHVNEN